MLTTQEIIKNFYTFYNTTQLDKLFSLIDDNLIHEFNHVQTIGKNHFIEFMTASKKHYDEQVNDYILMVSEDGRFATTKFKVKGMYLHTDHSGIPATGQAYELDVVNYFEIQNGKIIKGSCWYDENQWLKQVST